MNKRYPLLIIALTSICIVAKVAIDQERPVHVLPEEEVISINKISQKSEGNIVSEVKKEVDVKVTEKKKQSTIKAPQKALSQVDSKKEVDEILIKSSAQKEEKALVNKIAIVVYTDDDPIMITQHSLNCKTLDGRTRTMHELLMEKLMCYEALTYYKIPITDEMVDKHLASLKEMHGIGDVQIKQLFKEAGYTYEEGREQLRASYAIQSLMGQLVDGRVVVEENEVKEYYKKNPIKEQASFRIKTAFVKNGDMTDLQIQDLVEDGLYKDLVVWDSPYWLDIDEIAESKKYITSMKVGQVKSEIVADGHHMVMLVNAKQERIKPFEECRSDIIGLLRGKNRQERFASYEKELLNKYDIVYLT
ncbi:hypothetical protein K9K77_01985 [Candidatus Babeliales bacterium]|nr:hypothetical protein [Candidatus Babeliales bacterium]